MSMVKKYKNYVVTFGTELTIMILGFLVFRIANQQFDEYGFSEYSILRRTVSFLLPLMMIGLGVSIPRYISLEPNRNSYFFAGLTWILIAGLVLLTILALGNSFFSDVFFGSDKYSEFIVPMGLLLISYGLHAIVYGFLRGKLNIYLANLIQFINVGVIPLTVLYFSDSVLNLIYLNTISLFVSCVIVIGIIFKKYDIQVNKKLAKEDSVVLLKYGLPRVLGDFALLAILTLPTYIVLEMQDDILIGGDVAYCITLLNLVGAAFSPISLVLLPEIASFINQKRQDLIEKRFKVFVIICLALTAFGYVLFYLFTEFFLQLLLGSNFRPNLIEYSRIVLLSSFGYGLYIILRSFLDAIHVRATNAYNLLFCLGVYLIFVYFGIKNESTVQYFLYSFVVSIILLGLITLIQTYLNIKKIKW